MGIRYQSVVLIEVTYKNRVVVCLSSSKVTSCGITTILTNISFGSRERSVSVVSTGKFRITSIWLLMITVLIALFCNMSYSRF